MSVNTSYGQKVYNSLKAAAWDTAKGAVGGAAAGFAMSQYLLATMLTQTIYVNYQIAQVQNPNSCTLSDETVIPRGWIKICSRDEPTVRATNYMAEYHAGVNAIGWQILGILGGAALGAIYGSTRVISALAGELAVLEAKSCKVNNTGK